MEGPQIRHTGDGEGTAFPKKTILGHGLSIMV
jgi:hypothetical protein